jgi:hypothetical protein
VARMRPQGSAELNEVREAIGLHSAVPADQVPTPVDVVRLGGHPADSLGRGMRRLMGVVSALAGGVALTHQTLVGALAGAHGTGLWGAAATLLGWPAPLTQPIFAGVGALVLCAVGVVTRGWRDVGPGRAWLAVAGSIATILGAGPMVLVCVLTAIAFVLAVIICLVIVFYVLARLLR